MSAKAARLPLLTLLSFAIASGSCASGPHRPSWPPLPGVSATVRIWIDDSPNLPKDIVLQGCQGWRHKGVACALASDILDANIRVHEDKTDCVKNKDDDYYTLAWAYRGGNMYVRTKCFMAAGKIVPAKLRTVVTHEVGHELGIWEHVPLKCDGKDVKTHPSGKPVCGPAVMNPLYDPDVPEIDEVDGLAFDIRDLDIAVVDHREGGGHEPDCVFRGR